MKYKDKVQAYLREIPGLLPDHPNKVDTAMKQVKGTFWFPSTYESCVVYSIL